MTLKKITEKDLYGKGVVGMEDVPGLSALEMQKKVEEVVREVVIPVMNENTDNTVSKEELGKVLIEAGAGDMTTYQYDKNHDGRVDDAENGFSLYTHSITDRGHLIEGSGENIKFIAVRDWRSNPHLEVNGVEAHPVNSSNESVADDEIFKSGAVVSCFLHTDEEGALKCFFKSGGGIPDGATAMPINDVRKWQKCAGLKTGYTSVSQILADTNTLKALINNANAMEYLIRSVDIQAAVLADENAIGILDASMPFITPSMRGTNAPYGAITKADGYFNTGTFKAFNYTDVGTDNSNGSAYNGRRGAWVQYTFDGDRPVWLYKSQIRPTYVNSAGVVIRVQGVLKDGTVVDLSDDLPVGSISASNNTPTQIVHKANSHKCAAVRFYVVSGSSIYFNGGKIWGK